jgi:hypothetical protein
MNSVGLITRMQDLFRRCLEIAEAKNADYANEDDPFQNFRGVEVLGISVEDGFLTRMSDKLARVSNLVRRDPVVADESVLDTLSDLANYAVLLRVYLEEKRAEPVYTTVRLPLDPRTRFYPCPPDSGFEPADDKAEVHVGGVKATPSARSWVLPADDKRSWVDLPTKVYGIGGHYGGVEGDEGFAP